MRPALKTALRQLLAIAWLALPQQAASAKTYNILVLSSYNPDASNISSSISTFEKDLHKSGLDFTLTIEGLGFDYISEYSTWIAKMSELLSTYKTHDKRPDIIITLGQEAMSAYISLDVTDAPDVPVLCGMSSRNYIELPKGDAKFSADWRPEMRDIVESAALYNIIGGYFYTYDAERNVRLIKSLYPNVNTVAFMSDNSYGGVCMKALVGEYANHQKDTKFIWLDGRRMNIQSAADSIARLTPQTALLMGTWRFDKDSHYSIASTLSMIRQSNENVPIFTMSAVGINDCAMGGYTPNYQNIGALLAKSVQEYFANGKSDFHFIPCHYVFNDQVLTAKGIDRSKLPDGYDLVNKKESVFGKYFTQIALVSIIVILLTASLIIAIRNLRRMRKLQVELQRKQKELIVAKNRAESNSMLKTSFVANMSHEIRTPLNAVVGFSQVIATQGDSLSAEEKAHIVGIINKNCNLLTGLINSILDISRIESGRANYDIERIDVVDTCKAMLSSVKMANNALPIDFKFECAFDKLMFNTDRQRLQQVLMNILSNAVKFTQQGNVTLSLQSEEGGGIRVAVTDTGKGIPPDKANEVFNRFVKLDEYSNGTGLGLSLCQIIVEKFQGKIWVDTAYTAGARFIFTLPHITKEDLL